MESIFNKPLDEEVKDLNGNIGNKKYVSGSIDFEVTSASDWTDWGTWKVLQKSLDVSFGGAFTGTPYVIATPYNSGSDGSCVVSSVYNSSSKITQINLARPTVATGTFKIRWLAIGT